MTTAANPFPQGLAFDVVYQPAVSHPRALTKESTAAALVSMQRKRAQDAATEALFILEFAVLCPDSEDPPADHPGAKKTYWRTVAEFAGVSEFFVEELAAVLNVGRGTAAFRARRAFCWRDRLPVTFAALRRGEIDERRAQELFSVLEDVEPGLARRIDALLAPEATDLSVRALGQRARELVLELDAEAARERQEMVRRAADVFVQPRGDGMATVGCDLPAEVAAEIEALIDEAATMAKTDGDARPIGEIRAEIFSLLLRRPGLLAGVRASLTITASLSSLEGGSVPADVNGFLITPAQLEDLLRRVGALGLTDPDDGSLTFGLTDDDGRLLATASKRDLERAVAHGEGLNPPESIDRYEPNAEQREFVRTRDRSCRMPNCGRRTGWADHDHVVPHSCGGDTTCTNLCCLCRSHHRLKTLARGWLFVMDADGTLHVTTPSGITRTSRPPGLRPTALRPPGARPPEPLPEEPPPF